MAGKGRPRGKAAAAKGYQLPENIPEGFIVTNTHKKSFVIGSKIASGGFGTVYFASESGKKTFDYVVKVEYHANGPLFSEMHCYQTIGKPNQIADYIKERKLPYLGLSPCHGIGSFELNSSKYRFMVIERYGKDLQTLLEENEHVFSPKTVLLVGLSVLTSLEYIHSVGYVHGDVKAANLVLGNKKGTENQVYLVDMGLACKYKDKDTHKPEKPDPKKAHNGTPEFASRDAHRGCFSRRGDLEVLCYNLLQWLSGELPWECYKADPKKTQQEKIKYMNNVDMFLDTLLGEDCPDGIKSLVDYVVQLEFEEEPDYSYCQKLLSDELKKIDSKSKVLEFKKPSKKPVASKPLKVPTSDKENIKKPSGTKRKAEKILVLDPGDIPTPAMLEQMRKIQEKESKPKPTKVSKRK